MIPCRPVAAGALALALAACASTDSGGPVLRGNVNAPPPAIVAPGDALLTNTPWTWQSTRMSDGKRIVPDVPERYALTFLPGGRLNVRADCNRGTASYRLDDTALSIGPVATTKVMCPPGSQDTEFLRQLAEVGSQEFTGYELLLTLRGNAGVMHFVTPRQ